MKEIVQNYLAQAVKRYGLMTVSFALLAGTAVYVLWSYMDTQIRETHAENVRLQVLSNECSAAKAKAELYQTLYIECEKSRR